MPVRRPKKCPHGVSPTNCRLGCGGGAWCEHDTRRAECRVCKPQTYCRKECSGCPRGFLPYYCRECGGGACCQHDKYKSQCRECNGRSLCKTCRGAGICKRNRQKSHCSLCQNFVWCPKQGQRFGAAYLLRQCMQKRRGNNPRAVTRSKEHSATRRSPSSTSTTCPSAAAGWSRRRPTPSRTLPWRPRGATSCWRSQAGGAFHPPLSLCGGALVQARARRVPLCMTVPPETKRLACN